MFVWLYLYPTHIVFCFCFVCLRLVYPILLVSLNYPFWLPLRYSLTFVYWPIFQLYVNVKGLLKCIYVLANHNICVSTVCRSEQGCKLEEKCNQTLVPDIAITKTRTYSQQPRRTTWRRQKRCWQFGSLYKLVANNTTGSQNRLWSHMSKVEERLF
jgi:hypothetical protein